MLDANAATTILPLAPVKISSKPSMTSISDPLKPVRSMFVLSARSTSTPTAHCSSRRPLAPARGRAVAVSALAGALRDIQSGRIPEGSSVVCTLTGHGLKDPDTAIQQSAGAMQTVDAELGAVKAAILSNLPD